MPFLGALDSILARLEGKDFSFVPSLRHLEELKIRDGGVRHSETTVGIYEVPIKYYDATNERYAVVYPSLTYAIVDIQPRFAEWLPNPRGYKAESYSFPVESSKAQVLSSSGEDLGMCPRMKVTRDIEQPLDIMFEVRAYADSVALAAALVSYVYKCFPYRGFLRVRKEDGSFSSWDSLFLNFTNMSPKQQAAYEQLGIQREYVYIWTYRLEAYLDTSDTAELVNYVRRVDIENEKL